MKSGQKKHHEWTGHKSILKTWRISFDYIFQKRQSAANVLSLMSFCDRQSIPKTLVQVHGEDEKIFHGSKRLGKHVDSGPDSSDDDSSLSASDSDDDFEEDLVMLRNFSFVTVGVDTATFKMHRLVQLAMRIWLEKQEPPKQLEKWRDRFIKNLSVEFPYCEEKEDWPICQDLLPHAKAALDLRPQSKEALQNWAQILHHAAVYKMTRGRASMEAEQMALKSLDGRVDSYGKEHEYTINGRCLVALILSHTNHDRFKMGITHGEDALDTSRRVLGPEHPQTLRCMDVLAQACLNRLRVYEAQQLLRKVLEIRMKVLGPDNPFTLTSISNMAWIHILYKDMAEARQLLEGNLQISKRLRGRFHPETLLIMETLAKYCGKQQEFSELPGHLTVQVRTTSRKVVEPEGPRKLQIKLGICNAYADKLRQIRSQEQQVETNKALIGPASYEILADSMSHLAKRYNGMMRLRDCCQLWQKELEIRERFICHEDERTLDLLSDVANGYVAYCQFEEAVDVLKRELAMRKRVQGLEHWRVRECMEQLGRLLESLGRDEESYELRAEYEAMFLDESETSSE